MRSISRDDEELARRARSLDWECANANTGYLTHSIHRYSGKFIPQIARNAIELASKPNELVLDPYCGSGTTLLECRVLQRQSVGFDLNPLAILISKVKTQQVDAKVLAEYVKETEDSLRRTSFEQRGIEDFGATQSNQEQTISMVRNDTRWNDGWYKKWFTDKTRQELLVIHRQVMQSENPYCRDVALVAFSDILRRVSRAHSSYPNVMLDKNKQEPVSAISPYLKRLKAITLAVSELDSSPSDDLAPKILRANSERMPIQNSSVDAIVTHPPYVGSIPYAEYGLLSLKWLGYDPKEIDHKLTGGRRQSKDVLERFQDSFGKMLFESNRVLKDNGIFFMLLGSPTIRGRRIDLAEIATRLSISAGFRLVVTCHRAGINRRANLMSKESMLFFRKV